MNITASVFLDESEQTSQDLELGAFCGESVRGSVKLKYYDNIKKDYESFLQQNDNAVIKTLIEDGSFFETNIPKLKALTIKLKDKIGKLIEESHKMQDDLKDYQSILMQIQELENED